MFDTHAHLNFRRFRKTLDDVIRQAQESGVSTIVVPGTDPKSSREAIAISEKNVGVYAAVGIHPHHVIEANESELNDIESMISSDKVVAIGEIGLDRHVYEETKYEEYHVDETFIQKQVAFFKRQLALAARYSKPVIIHNREAKDTLFEVLKSEWDERFSGNMVFHCCEPDDELFAFAKERGICIGVDGDVTWDNPESLRKREFIKQVLIEAPDLLVLETDSPFLLPEPHRSERKYPNVPANISVIATFIAEMTNVTKDELLELTTKNARRLFNLK